MSAAKTLYCEFDQHATSGSGEAYKEASSAAIQSQTDRFEFTFVVRIFLD